MNGGVSFVKDMTFINDHGKDKVNESDFVKIDYEITRI